MKEDSLIRVRALCLLPTNELQPTLSSSQKACRQASLQPRRVSPVAEAAPGQFGSIQDDLAK